MPWEGPTLLLPHSLILPAQRCRQNLWAAKFNFAYLLIILEPTVITEVSSPPSILTTKRGLLEVDFDPVRKNVKEKDSKIPLASRSSI